MKKLVAILALTASPAFAAAGKPFFSLSNTDFVVTVGFLVFVGILIYYKVPAKIGALLDGRAAQIKAELEEARALRDEAKAVLASYEKKQKEVQEQSQRIVASAKEEAMNAAAQAKADLKASIARRLAAAEEQIASAEAICSSAAARRHAIDALRSALACAAAFIASSFAPATMRSDCSSTSFCFFS